MDNATKRDLRKQDQFHTITEKGIGWANTNRRSAAIAAGLVLVLILAIVGGYVGYEHRSASAETAFGAAMQTYQAPLVNAGEPIPPGMKSYSNAAERAKTANAQFNDVASKYGLTRSGKLAVYFSGVTYMEEGQNASAEETLKKAASGWDSDLAATAKLALAQLYQQTGRDSQAVDIYNDLAKGKSSTVPPTLAQLQLAELYTAEGKGDKAKEIYAKIKDNDKDSKGDPGPAATIAKEKLDPKPTGPQE